MGKKNLDKLFQDKLKDFSQAPDENVWQTIEASLDKKKKSRKVIPLWWKLGGIAAVLIFTLVLVNPFKQGTSPIVTDTESIENRDKQDDIKSPSDIKKEDLKIELVETNDSAESENQVVTSNSDTDNTITESTSSKKESIILKNALNTASSQVAENASKNLGNNENVRPSSNNTNTDARKDIGIANTSENNGFQKKMNSNIKDSILPPKEKTLFDLNKASENTNSDIAQIEEREVEESNEDSKKKSIFDEIALQNSEEELAAENKKPKWSAGPSVAPVYFDAIGEGSPVHSSFVSNSKSGDLNLSYGLSVAYQINNRLSVRSGLHKVAYGYDTNEIEFSTSLESSTNGRIANIDYAANSENLVVVSSARQASTPAENFSPTTDDVVNLTTASQSGVMSQQFGYLEVPLELEYALLDKKFGVNVIGGISSLFLIDNSISLSSENLTTEMGEANNINSINFSTNVGIGLNYKFTQKLQLNVEPVFKYQMNTFSQTNGNFQPFSVGVYSGISFKF